MMWLDEQDFCPVCRHRVGDPAPQRSPTRRSVPSNANNTSNIARSSRSSSNTTMPNRANTTPQLTQETQPAEQISSPGQREYHMEATLHIPSNPLVFGESAAPMVDGLTATEGAQAARAARERAAQAASRSSSSQHLPYT